MTEVEVREVGTKVKEEIEETKEIVEGEMNTVLICLIIMHMRVSYPT